MDCTICVAKTKALISFAVTAKLICVFVFAYAKIRFSHDEAHIFTAIKIRSILHRRDIIIHKNLSISFRRPEHTNAKFTKNTF